MSPISAIEAVQLKLDRADRHIAELERELDSYYATRPIYLEGSFDAATSQWVTIVRVTREPPAELGPIIGDIAHNLRSALDQVTWQLARLATPDPYERTQFPILTVDGDWERVGARMVQSLRSEHAAFIELLQPYHDDEPKQTLLYALSRLSNVDKHREVHFANSALMGASLGVRMLGGEVGMKAIHLAFGEFSDRSEVARIDLMLGKINAPPQLEVELEGAFDLAVTDDDGTQLSVYAGLYATREFVGDLVDWLAPLLADA